MKIYPHQLNDLIRYAEYKQNGKDVMAGLLRQSASFDMEQALKDFEKGSLQVIKASDWEQERSKLHGTVQA
jgi:hypothetical protein